jgi:hypothetical protein
VSVLDTERGREALAGLIAGVVVEEADRAVALACGREVDSAPRSEPSALADIREMARSRAEAEVARRVAVTKGAIRMEQQRSAGVTPRPSSAVLEVVAPAQRPSDAVLNIVEHRQEIIDSAREATPARPRDLLGRYEACLPARDDEVDVESAAVLESPLGAPVRRPEGFRDEMRARGLSDETLAAWGSMGSAA